MAIKIDSLPPITQIWGVRGEILKYSKKYIMLHLFFMCRKFHVLGIFKIFKCKRGGATPFGDALCIRDLQENPKVEKVQHKSTCFEIFETSLNGHLLFS